MQPLTYGALPDVLVVGETYNMELVGEAREVVARAINQGIDSHLEAVCFDQYDASNTVASRLGLNIEPGSVRVLLRRLVEQWHGGCEESGSLAGDILGTLGYEWE